MIRFSFSVSSSSGANVGANLDAKTIAREKSKAELAEKFGLDSDPNAVVIVGDFKKSKKSRKRRDANKGMQRMQGDSVCVHLLKKRFDTNLFIAREIEKLKSNDMEKFMNAFNDLTNAKNRLQEIITCLVKLDEFPMGYRDTKTNRISLGLDKIIEGTYTNLTNFLCLCKISDEEKKALLGLDNKLTIIFDSIKRIMIYLIMIRDIPSFAKNPKIDKRYESNNPGSAIDKYLLLLNLVYEHVKINEVLLFEKNGVIHQIDGSNITEKHIKMIFTRVSSK